MRPISLEIEGFTSFRERVVIDFSKFDLFAITGPTGAGKTSIIDAMIYALYGYTPRLGKQSISELISQGADRLKVLLEFSSGKQRFRIARETKWTGKSSSTSPRLEEWNGDKWVSLADKVSEADSRIEKIIGLDFNGFTKSVVLPQGQFDVFLKGKADERRRILSDLLQLDVYQRMMKRANEIAQQHKKEADVRADLLARDYANATPEHLKSLQQELADRKPQLEPLKTELARIREAVPVALQLRQSRSQLASADAELKKLKPQQAAGERSRAAIQAGILDAQKRVAELEAKIKTTTYDSAWRDQLVSKQHRSERLQQAQRRLLELDKANASKAKEHGQLETGLKAAQAVFDSSTKDRDALQKQSAAGRKELGTFEKKYGTPDSIKNLIRMNQLRRRAEEIKSKLEADLTGLTEKKKKREARLAKLSHDLTASEKAVAKARAELEHLQQLHAAEELKHALEAGQPCPVCEREVTRVPKARKHPSIDHARKAIKALETQATLLLEEKSKTSGELGEMKPQFNKFSSDIEDQNTAVAEATSLIRTVLKTAPGHDTESALQQLYQTAGELQEKVNLSAEQFEKARERASKAKDAAEDLKRRHSVLESERSSVLDEIKRLKTEAEQLKTELGEFADLALVMDELKKQDQAKHALDSLNRSREAEAAALSKAKDEVAEASVRLEGLKSRANDLAAAQERLRADIDDRRKALQTAFTELKVDVTEAAGDAVSQLERRRAEAQSRLDSLQRDTLRIEEQIKTVETQIKRATKMRVEIEQHRAESAVAHDLALALRGDQFVAFIQQEAYHRLAIDGSVHLKTLSSDRYSFDFEKDEFVVRDHWNADEPRPVATLSGGESFLASLALALALAEGLSGLSHGHSRFALESLFLDEGFGTLDPETLDTVLQGVENLSTTDRLVGIVSHIPELADRMPSRVYVRKSAGGSTVEVV
jgi:exonuclease SbcC